MHAYCPEPTAKRLEPAQPGPPLRWGPPLPHTQDKLTADRQHYPSPAPPSPAEAGTAVPAVSSPSCGFLTSSDITNSGNSQSWTLGGRGIWYNRHWRLALPPEPCQNTHPGSGRAVQGLRLPAP